MNRVQIIDSYTALRLRSGHKKILRINRGFFCGAGRGSRTPISALARQHNSRYTIPACYLIVAIDYQKMKKLARGWLTGLILRDNFNIVPCIRSKNR